MTGVSVRDVAAAAGVSVGTVSNVLNDDPRVAPAIVERVLAAVADLGYVRNAAARQLRAGRSVNVGLVVPDASNPFFAEVARGAEEAARAAGLAVFVGNAHGDAAREVEYLRLFEEQRALGLLLSPIEQDAARWRHLRGRGIPVVLVDYESADGSVSSVSVDDRAGGRIAVEHLLERGARRVAVVGGEPRIAQVAERVAGAREATGAFEALELIPTDATTVLDGRRAGEELLARPAPERPDAVFAVNDLVAVGLLQALVMTGGMRVPEDLLLIGYDDIDFATAAVVPLSSVRQPSRDLGESALGLLREEAEDPVLAPRRVVFRPELVVRASSGG